MTNAKQALNLVDLQVGHTSPVVWNKEAFGSLVIDAESKKQIISLVKGKPTKELADVVDGKGAGERASSPQRLC